MKFKRTMIEIPITIRRSFRMPRPSYRWVQGYIQLNGETEIHPALRYHEARRLAREAKEKMEVVD